MVNFSEISSRENPLVKLVSSLQSSAKSRKETGLFVIEGLRICGDALENGVVFGRLEMFGYNIKFISTNKKTYSKDLYDYYSLSHFKVDDIKVTIEVLWDNNPSQKYIDLYYDNFIIRLDSMKQSVIDLTNKKVLFKGQNDRMTNHYIGVFNDYIKNKSNYEISIKLHKELLKGVKNEN